ncbi:SGNH/GDSL hydrolase family protein [Lactimicrobium massiliense]|uniref:SGNH/GDSL hydrolase family protein n=1 Tax=Lactimicrobium massiliense TaxID=2161814 RepID=UPI000D55C5CD|nr:SGNH/GDSL hydrolase family protein [Lactimicrobium massiliense]
MHKKRNIALFLCSILSTAVVLWLLQRLFMPKYVDDVLEGTMTQEYYDEENKDFDVMFIGDCEVYETYNPVELWQKYGINSYIRGNAEQYIWQSYYMLKESLHYHIPKVVVFNAQSLQFNESQNEAYNRMALDGMKWSREKVDAINASMKENEHFIDYVFPFLRYHSRWSDLKETDFTYMFKHAHHCFNGYYMRVDILPADNVPDPRPLTDYTFGDKAWEYMDKIRKLCEENGIQLILVKAPSLWPHWYDEYNQQVKEYADQYGLPYYNWLEYKDDIGLDYSTDTYDAGLHLNLSGADKMSDYFGQILVDQYGVPDRRNETALASSWQKVADAQNAEIENQKKKYNLN